MARKAQDTLWLEQQELQELQALEHFHLSLSALPDPRRKQGQRYPLRSIVVIALMALVCGADDARAMQDWGEINEDWLEGFLDLPHGAPTQDVFLGLFARLEPTAFREVFRHWVSLLWLRIDGQDRQIAVDGKTSRGSLDRGSGKRAIHTVSAWLVEAGLVPGQHNTDQKSNEITAIPELLKLLDLSGATITIDPMGCQKAIAQTIVEGQGDYLLGVKENQPTLHAEIAQSFADGLDTGRRPVDQPSPLRVERWHEVNKGHGRLEERTVYVCRDLSWLSTREQWVGLSLIARVDRVRTEILSGKVQRETNYYIGSSATATVEEVGRQIRRHWSIENELHWVLDVAFNEDHARHRAGNCAQNMATLRHFALDLLKSESSAKVGVANKRKKAGWSRNYLLQVLTGER